MLRATSAAISASSDSAVISTASTYSRISSVISTSLPGHLRPESRHISASQSHLLAPGAVHPALGASAGYSRSCSNPVRFPALDPALFAWLSMRRQAIGHTCGSSARGMAPPSHGQLSGCSCWTLRGSGLAYRSASRSPALVATGATRLDACLRVFVARGHGATLSISGATPMVRLDGHMSWPPDRGMAPPMRCHSPLRIAMEYLGVLRCYGTGWGSIEARPGTLRYNASRDYGRACALRRPAAFLAFPSVFSCKGAEW